jgi:lipoyl(octanoyl) transferase
MSSKIITRYFGIVDYDSTWSEMKSFTKNRDLNTNDEIWILEHEPIFTQGLAGKPENILVDTKIPVIKSDRGGQITYHGPGQIIFYLLFDLKRLKLGIKKFVSIIEQSVMDLLIEFDIHSELVEKAPGVYVDGMKIAQLGLKVKNGLTYHGLSLNFDMDLKPFETINPCGYKDLKVTQLTDLKDNIDKEKTIKRFTEIFSQHVSRN